MRSTSGVRGREGRSNRPDDTLQIVVNVSVPKAHDPIAFTLQECGSVIVREAACMLPAIGLNNQTMLLAGEIDDKRTNRLLPAEFGSVEFCAFER